MKLYRVLTVLINCFLVFGILATVYETIVGGYSDTEESILFSILATYMVLSTSYFIWKTRKLSKHRINSDILDEVVENSLDMHHFPLAKLICISNLAIGSLIIITAVFVLIAYPVRFVIIEELFRFCALIFGIFYGFLKIYYSFYSLKRIKKVNSEQANSRG